MNLKVLFEDENIIVCKKESGISSQTERGFAPDMVSILMNYQHEKGIENPYVGVIHRLDKPVSGVMVYAKNKTAAAFLSKELANKQFNKKYYAIVIDNNCSIQDTLKVAGTLRNHLIHDVKANSSYVTNDTNNNEAKEAILNYKIMGTTAIDDINLALLDIELFTGRHHQIRVQLSHAGFPIIGDKKYNSNMPEKLPYKLKKTGLALCAYNLSFKHPVTKEIMEFSLEPDGLYKQF